MGFRFHKSLKLIPGMRLNISKSGPSLSLGGRGLTYNIGRRGRRTTVGLPGTGLSYSSVDTGKGKSAIGPLMGWILAALCFLFYIIRQ